MADRQDIDALLISALYGELDGEERERLEAHLASHPQDRAALEDLKSTRAMFRDASMSIGSAEPAPAISAKLLQEAARRAPVPKAAAGAGFLGWFASLLRPFATNPALSAAAAVVVVGGAAGVMYANGSFRAAQPEHVAEARNEARGEAAGTSAPTPDLPGAATGAGTGTSYQVALDEAANADIALFAQDGDDATKRKQVALDGRLAAKPAAPSAGADGQLNYRSVPGGEGKDAVAKKESAEGFAAVAESARPAPKAKAGAKSDGYLEVDKNSPTDPRVRDLEDDAVEGEQVTGGLARGGGGGSAPGNAATGTTAPTSPQAAPPPPPAVATQKPSTSRDVGRAPVYDAKAEAQLTAWARDQHSRMAKLVAAGKCNDAGTVGAEISRKAPEYYQANVANDRAIRACRSYVERARRAKAQEDAKSRAGRANDARVDSYESPAPTTK